MACACTMSQDEIDARKAAAKSRVLACHFCIHAEHGPSAWGDGPISCTIDNQPIVGRTRCPKRKMKRKGGVQFIRSLGLWNIGAPWWQRKVVGVCKATSPRYEVFGGCGCVAVLKRWAEWLAFGWSIARRDTCFDARY